MNVHSTSDEHVTGQVTLSIDGMSCGRCVQVVTQALSNLPAVNIRSVTVGKAEVEVLAPGAADDAVAALVKAGYRARVEPASASGPGAAGCCGKPKGCCGS